MGETKTPHIYDFRIFEPVTKPQNQLILSLETPGHRTKKQATIPTYFLKHFIFRNLVILETHHFVIFRKDGHRQMMTTI